jgi:hypothetical protein
MKDNPDKKQKIDYKEKVDKKHYASFDDDKLVKKQRKQFKQRKMQMSDEDSMEELQDYT